MSQQIINVGAAPNDGQGDPIRTAFTKCNNNFDQLFAGSTSNAAIENGNTVVEIATANGNVTMSVAGTANVVVVTPSGQLITGDVSATGALISNSVSAAGFTGAIQFRNSSGYLASNGNLAWDAGNLALYAYKHMSGNGGFSTDEATLRIGNINPHVIDMGGNATVINIGNSSGNVNFAGNVSVAGNVTGAYFTGNGAGLTGVIATGNVGVASQLSNGTSSFNIPVANGNVVGNISGNTDVYIFTGSGANIAGYVNATANITAGNLLTSGLVSVAGNINANYINVTQDIQTNYLFASANIGGGNVILTGIFYGSGASVVGNTISGNVTTTGVVTATGNVTGGNLLTGGQVSATGNISTNTAINGFTIVGNSLITTSGNIGVGAGTLTMIIGNSTPTTVYMGGGASNIYLANANSVTTIAGNLVVGADVSAAGNVTSGNIITAGLVSATGNITANYYSGNGRQLTGQGMSFKITAANSVSYLVNGGYANTTIGLTRGQTYLFEVSAPSHPLWIKTDPVIGTGNAYSTGVTNNGAGNGTVQFSVPFDAPGTLYYQCQFHTGMYGILNITDNATIQYGNSNAQVYSNGVVNLSSNVAVTVSGGGTFRLPNLDASQIANLSPSNGDLLYNTSINKIQGYENGSWGNLI